MIANFQNQFLGEELTPGENNPKTSRFHVIPCGLERTVSYGTGTGRGPAAIIEASHQLERWDGKSEPCTHGIFTHAPLDCRGDIADVLKNLEVKTAAIAQEGKVPVTLGGEHSLTYGAMMGVRDALDEPVGIIQVDAHADFRLAYQGHRHSHASVMNLLSSEGAPIASIGVRTLCKEEHHLRQEVGVSYFDAPDLVPGNVQSIELPGNFPKNVYLTFDLDGLDPSILPATGTPVPGGLGYYQALNLVRSALQGRTCVGFDVVELAPIPNLPASDFTAAQITYALMGIITGESEGTAGESPVLENI